MDLSTAGIVPEAQSMTSIEVVAHTTGGEKVAHMTGVEMVAHMTGVEEMVARSLVSSPI